MARTADAVVVGAGIIGASIAFHLTRLGLRRVVVCERRRPGLAATGASGGFIQFHFCRDETETRLTQASLPWFAQWDERVGAGTAGFTPCGYLRLEPAARVGALRERVTLLRGLGVDSRVIDPREVGRLAPYLRLDGVAAAAHEPGSGYADPNAALAGLLAATQRAGGEVLVDAVVTRLRGARGRTLGVDATPGPIDAPIVVVAAGAWTRDLLLGTGLDLPLENRLTQWSGFTVPGAPAEMPTIGDGVSGSYFLQRGETFLVGLGEAGRRPLRDLDAPEPPIPPEIVGTARERLAARLVGAERALPAGGRSGPVTLTPDDRPIVDRHPEFAGLFFFAGDGGASFKTAPALGLTLAEWALEQPTTLDLSALRLSRFSPTETRDAAV